MAFWSLCGGLLWLVLREPWGRVGYWVFSILGFLVGLVITRAFLKGRILLFFPFPPCQKGKCKEMGPDYTWRLGTLFGYERNGLYLYKCGCGDLYLREGNRFMRLEEGDKLSPYKRLKAFREWEDDKEDGAGERT